MGINQIILPMGLKDAEVVGKYEQLKAAWRSFFADEARINATYVHYDKWCECGSGRNRLTGKAVMGKVFYFNDEESAGWACIKCKHPASPDKVKVQPPPMVEENVAEEIED